MAFELLFVWSEGKWRPPRKIRQKKKFSFKLTLYNSCFDLHEAVGATRNQYQLFGLTFHAFSMLMSLAENVLMINQHQLTSKTLNLYIFKHSKRKWRIKNCSKVPKVTESKRNLPKNIDFCTVYTEKYWKHIFGLLGPFGQRIMKN